MRPRARSAARTRAALPSGSLRATRQPQAGAADAATETLELAMLSTDGYAKSHADDAEFAKVASDLARMIRNHGFDAVTPKRQGWLRETTEGGSGDDISIALLSRPVTAELQPDPVKTTEPAQAQENAANEHDTGSAQAEGAAPLAGTAAGEPGQ